MKNKKHILFFIFLVSQMGIYASEPAHFLERIKLVKKLIAGDIPEIKRAIVGFPGNSFSFKLHGKMQDLGGALYLDVTIQTNGFYSGYYSNSLPNDFLIDENPTIFHTYGSMETLYWFRSPRDNTLVVTDSSLDSSSRSPPIDLVEGRKNLIMEAFSLGLSSAKIESWQGDAFYGNAIRGFDVEGKLASDSVGNIVINTKFSNKTNTSFNFSKIATVRFESTQFPSFVAVETLYGGRKMNRSEYSFTEVETGWEDVKNSRCNPRLEYKNNYSHFLYYSNGLPFSATSNGLVAYDRIDGVDKHPSKWSGVLFFFVGILVCAMLISLRKKSLRTAINRR